MNNNHFMEQPTSATPKLRYTLKSFFSDKTNAMQAGLHKKIMKNGVGRTTLNRVMDAVETDTWYPTHKTLKIICDTLGLTLNDLINDKN